jgi:hypothetical protein
LQAFGFKYQRAALISKTKIQTEDDIKIVLKKKYSGDVNWTEIASDWVQWQDCVLTVFKLQVLIS